MTAYLPYLIPPSMMIGLAVLGLVIRAYWDWIDSH